ncbi:unnamed protein product [Cylicostephanus goldi]|uniref:Uncharacterized protein n=1 Tax=Cylicostephanus goldi TaxID=71465 RepID=A0A3P6RL67_CYLGO|nr:unnamed protein product [Cylicostephanus goldi]
MFNEYDVYLEGSTDGDGPFFEQMIPSTSGIAAGQAMPRYVVAEDDAWIQSLSDVIYQEDTTPSPVDAQYEDVQIINQIPTDEEVYLMPDEGHEVDELIESVDNLQVAANEIVEDEMVQTQVEPIEYIQGLSGEMVQDVPTYLEPSQIVPIENTRVRYIVQQPSQLYEVPQNARVRSQPRRPALGDSEDTSLVYLTQLLGASSSKVKPALCLITKIAGVYN